MLYFLWQKLVIKCFLDTQVLQLYDLHLQWPGTDQLMQLVWAVGSAFSFLFGPSVFPLPFATLQF